MLYSKATRILIPVWLQEIIAGREGLEKHSNAIPIRTFSTVQTEIKEADRGDPFEYDCNGDGAKGRSRIISHRGKREARCGA